MFLKLSQKIFPLLIIPLLILLFLDLKSRQNTNFNSPPTNAVKPAESESPDKKLLMTYYFYWYDAKTGAHMDNLKHNFPQGINPSWDLVAWHEKELADMSAAGIDVALADYWGLHDKKDEWSYKGLDYLFRAWTNLKLAGKRPPKIGMFFDTTIINKKDLTTEEGKEFFYANFKDFFTRIPKPAWALINDRPVAFLFTSDWTKAVDQSTFDYVYENFQKDFGVKPYIIREVSWDYPISGWKNGQRVRDYQNPIKTENSYLWGSAMNGFVDRGGVAVVGPGYDDRGLPSRGKGTFTDRENGEFYKRNFQKALESKKPLIVIETWNEMHEGSSIAETAEFGKKYIEITREFADKFHQ